MDLKTCVAQLLPEFILLVGGCVTLLAGASPPRPDGRGSNAAGPIAVGVVLLALLATAWQGVPADALQPAPGILITPLVCYVRLGALFVGLAGVLCSQHLPAAGTRSEFFSMLVFSLLGLLLTASANNLLLLFFAVELVSVPTYVLVALSREDKRASEAAVKYFFLGALSAGLMVYGFSFLYGSLGGALTLMPDGTGLNMHDTAAATAVTHPFIVIGLLLALSGAFFKMAAVPFHVYAPDVYEGAASPVTGMLGFLPKFAGLLVGAKLLAVFDWGCAPQVFWLIWIVAALTMTVGNTLALLQSNVKRILAYSSIAHSGYMLIGLLAGPALVAGEGPMRDGIAAMLFYMVIYGTMNLGAFAVLSTLANRGHAAEQLHDLRGLSRRFPLLAIALAVCVFSLMGFPPTAGLLGKVYIFSSAFAVGDNHPFGSPLVILAVIGVINSAIGAAYYLRIVAACFTTDPAEKGAEGDGLATVGGWPLRAGVVICSVAMLLAFIWPAPISRRARLAADGLVHTPQRVALNQPVP